ncbi:hypothetical protein HU200_025482 [Digitaria exilis]|uniref:Uncharacterized protein n=1 Tax=Digitaria exilis TaxID=1010633 RepID=A0A835C4N5_9POAL|nr:hypothetical protein HU200_025482 [Digitaria exilis]
MSPGNKQCRASFTAAPPPSCPEPARLPPELNHAGRVVHGFLHPNAPRRTSRLLPSSVVESWNVTTPICVYDPMTGGCTLLPDPPPEMAKFSSLSDHFAKRSAHCFGRHRRPRLSPPRRRFLPVRAAASSDSGEWSPATSVSTHPRSHDSSLPMRGGRDRDDPYHILTLSYNACTLTATAGSIKLPMNRLPEHYRNMVGYDANIRLASSPYGRQSETIQFKCSWERSGMVLFYVLEDGKSGLIALDVEKNEMHRVDGHRHMPFIPFKVDLEPRGAGAPPPLPGWQQAAAPFLSS